MNGQAVYGIKKTLTSDHHQQIRNTNLEMVRQAHHPEQPVVKAISYNRQSKGNIKIQNSKDQNGRLNLRISWILSTRHSHSFRFSPGYEKKSNEISKCLGQHDQNGVALKISF
jgi:hypothetical protein